MVVTSLALTHDPHRPEPRAAAARDGPATSMAQYTQPRSLRLALFRLNCERPRRAQKDEALQPYTAYDGNQHKPLCNWAQRPGERTRYC